MSGATRGRSSATSIVLIATSPTSSLNPGRCVGTVVEELEDEVFDEQLAAAHAELRELAARAAEIEAGVDHVLTRLRSR